MNFVEEQEEIKANIAIIPNVIEADFILTLDNIFTNSTKLIFIMFEKPCKDTKKNDKYCYLCIVFYSKRRFITYFDSFN